MFKRYLKLIVREICSKAFGELGLTEEELAREADLAPSTVYKLRTGRTQDPRFQTMFKLCRVVGMTKQVTRELAELANS